MALRHAVLAALLNGEQSGYQLAKAFDIGVANFWQTGPQQLYLELNKLEDQGLVTGRQVIQQQRPNKRMFTVTAAGIEELEHFAAAACKPSFIRDDLMVMVQAADAIDPAAVVKQLEERAQIAAGKVAAYDGLLDTMRGELDEESFLRKSAHVGPYLTCLRGRAFEAENYAWCERAAEVLRSRSSKPAKQSRGNTRTELQR